MEIQIEGISKEEFFEGVNKEIHEDDFIKEVIQEVLNG